MVNGTTRFGLSVQLNYGQFLRYKVSGVREQPTGFSVFSDT